MGPGKANLGAVATTFPPQQWLTWCNSARLVRVVRLTRATNPQLFEVQDRAGINYIARAEQLHADRRTALAASINLTFTDR